MVVGNRTFKNWVKRTDNITVGQFVEEFNRNFKSLKEILNQNLMVLDLHFSKNYGCKSIPDSTFCRWKPAVAFCPYGSYVNRLLPQFLINLNLWNDMKPEFTDHAESAGDSTSRWPLPFLGHADFWFNSEYRYKCLEHRHRQWAALHFTTSWHIGVQHGTIERSLMVRSTCCHWGSQAKHRISTVFYAF